MKRMLLVGAAISLAASLCLLSSGAHAADVPIATAPGAPVMVRQSWTGFYAGVNAGYGTSVVRIDVLDGGNSIGSDSRKFNGLMAGAQVGFNHQIGNFVWGVEGDYQKSWRKVSRSAISAFDVELEVPWFATARVRAGIANGPSLFYLAGGAVWTEGELTVSSSVSANGFAEKRDGWTIGGGYEAMLSPQWSWKLEYLYVKVRDKETNLPSDGVGFSVVQHLRDHIIRVGVNYRFGG